MAQRMEDQQVDAEVNAYLRRELLAANDRDPVLVNRHLDEIQNALRDKVEEFDRLLFGGSIAKHTYVEGLSDVDTLVILDDPELGDRTPDEFRREFARTLKGHLSAGDVEDIQVGVRAVTVVYRDGTQIQLLPAISRGGTISISARDGHTWQHGIRPTAFTDRLTATNRAQGGMVVPVIKLAKQVIATRVSEAHRPYGHLVEALAVDAFTGYDGPRTPRAMATHFFTAAAQRINSPMPDLTGQSRFVDEDLGSGGSTARVEMSRELGRIATTMKSSRSVNDWRRLFE